MRPNTTQVCCSRVDSVDSSPIENVDSVDSVDSVDACKSTDASPAENVDRLDTLDTLGTLGTGAVKYRNMTTNNTHANHQYVRLDSLRTRPPLGLNSES